MSPLRARIRALMMTLLYVTLIMSPFAPDACSDCGPSTSCHHCSTGENSGRACRCRHGEEPAEQNHGIKTGNHCGGEASTPGAVISCTCGCEKGEHPALAENSGLDHLTYVLPTLCYVPAAETFGLPHPDRLPVHYKAPPDPPPDRYPAC